MGYTSVGAVARRVSVHPSLIYKEVTEGRLPAIKIGKPNSKRPTIRIPIAALEAWELAYLTLGGKK
jgi:hypothetical protein